MSLLSRCKTVNGGQNVESGISGGGRKLREYFILNPPCLLVLRMRLPSGFDGGGSFSGLLARKMAEPFKNLEEIS
jgi:hypothetical protein